MTLKIKKVIPIMAIIITVIFTANTANAISSDFCSLVDSLYQYAIGAVGILSALGIAIAGVIWITAAGNSSKIGEAQSWIISSLLGLALALGAYFILNIINPDLALCGNYSISSIASMGNINTSNPNNTTSLPKKAGYKGTICNTGDGSGEHWCCIINGQLDGADWFNDPSVKRCCTLEFKDKNEAEKWCKNWYRTFFSYKVFGMPNTLSFSIFTDPKSWNYSLEKYYFEDQESTGTEGKNSITVYAKKCSERADVNNWCIARMDPNFCADPKASDGDYCDFAVDLYGYCKNKKCYPCKTWGDACTKDYECPNQAHKLTIQKNAKCGKESLIDFASNLYNFGPGYGPKCENGKCAYVGN